MPWSRGEGQGKRGGPALGSGEGTLAALLGFLLEEIDGGALHGRRRMGGGPVWGSGSELDPGTWVLMGS